MTSELAQAIGNYAIRPNLIRRELVVSLVREGHLSPPEYKRLLWALEPYCENVMRLWVNKARTVLVSEMDDGNLTVALRDEEGGDIWGVPILCVSEGDEKYVNEKTGATFSIRHRESRA